MIVLVPAFEPGAALTTLIRDMWAADPDVEVVVVDDGSGPAFADRFAVAARLGATVLIHAENRGKGAALKTGIDHVLAHHPGEDVVTADADGQHTVADIERLAAALREDAAAGTPSMILGCRGFTGRVPLRSRVGNALARALFRAAAGWGLSDTQTGLRGIPSIYLDWLRAQPGERFEFEQNVLLRSRRDGIETREIAIDTVYLDGNASSHFRPVADSMRIMVPLLLFAASSFLAFVVDTLALLVLSTVTGALVPSIIAARILSASANFFVNSRVVFAARQAPGRRAMAGRAARYALLATALLASNVVWIEALTGWGMPLVVAKVVTEIVLFVTSYGVQKTFVFRETPFVSPAEGGHRSLIAVSGRMDRDALENGRRP